MKIKKIEIYGLFGMFDHTIELKQGGVSIIFGKNGIGKTAIFKIVNALFNQQLTQLVDIVFSEVKITFDDDDFISAQKNTTSLLSVSYLEKGRAPLITEITAAEIKKSLEWLETRAQIRGYTMIEIDGSFFKDKDGKILTKEELFDIEPHLKNYELLPNTFSTFLLKSRLQQVKVSFLTIDRLQIKTAPIKNKDISYKETATEHSKFIQKMIQTAKVQYANVSQKIAARPTKERIPDRAITADELRTQTIKLIAIEQKLHSLGILDEVADRNLAEIDELNENERSFEFATISDKLEILEVYADIEKKGSLFLQILNNSFDFKTVKISDKGFVIKNNLGVDILPSELSSGEKHLLVLFFQLIFKTPENSLVLIDEPELSLHVDWQDKFVENLQNIAQLQNIDFIIATHSPDIADGRANISKILK